MNYIYDVLINWKNELYDFFEWNTEDDITHIRKIPLVKVSRECLAEMKDNIVQVDVSFLEKIHHKTEVFSNKKGTTISYACIFCDNYEALAVRWNEKGIGTSKSRLLVDEEAEVLEIANMMEEEKINFKNIKKSPQEHFHTRKEMEQQRYLGREIEKLVRGKQIDKLRYLYFECFNRKEMDISMILQGLVEALKNNQEGVYSKMIAFFKLSSIR